MTPWYAMWAQRYMHEFGVTGEDLAEVAVTHRYHATLKPDSVMGSRGPLTVEDVVGSRMVASPLHLFDCAVDTDGGYAMVVASAEVARGTQGKPVWVIGGAEATHTDGYTTIDAPWFPEQGHSVRRSGDIAFAQAGVTRDDIDVAGPYDCFTITMLRDLEELGFCKLGEGAAYFKEGHTRLGGVDARQHRRRAALEHPLRPAARAVHRRGRAPASRRMRRAAGSRAPRSASRWRRAPQCTATPAP